MKRIITACFIAMALTYMVAPDSEAITEGEYQSLWIADVFTASNGWSPARLQSHFASGGLEMTQGDAAKIIAFEEAGNFPASRAYGQSLFGGQITGGGGAVIGGASGPIGVNSARNNRVFRSQIIRQITPKNVDDQDAAAGAAIARLNSFSAEVFYNTWEVGNTEGTTYGLNPSYVTGDQVQFGLTVPLQLIAQDDLDDMYGVGVDASLALNLLEGKVQVGAHGFGMMQTGEEDPFKDETTMNYVGGGPFASLNLWLTDVISLSVGVLYEITEPEDLDRIEELIPGANVGVRLSDSVALNGYGMYFMDIDDEGIDDYYDIGGDVKIGNGTWIFSIGAKTTLGIDEVDSLTGYVGSEWGW